MVGTQTTVPCKALQNQESTYGQNTANFPFACRVHPERVRRAFHVLMQVFLYYSRTVSCLPSLPLPRIAPPETNAKKSPPVVNRTFPRGIGR
jgi:hypothetical protein